MSETVDNLVSRAHLCRAERIVFLSCFWCERAEILSTIKCHYDGNLKDKALVENNQDYAGTREGLLLIKCLRWSSTVFLSLGKVCLLMSMHDIIRDCKTSRDMWWVCSLHIRKSHATDTCVNVIRISPSAFFVAFAQTSQLAMKSNTERICGEQMT